MGMGNGNFNEADGEMGMDTKSYYGNGMGWERSHGKGEGMRIKVLSPHTHSLKSLSRRHRGPTLKATVTETRNARKNIGI